MIYIVRINDNEYEVEVERGKANILTISDAKPTVQAPQTDQTVNPAPLTDTGAMVSGEPLPAPMSGIIADIRIKTGNTVKAGQTLMILEAMKMENEIAAPRDGVIEQIIVGKGNNVSTGDVLLIMK